MGVAQFRAEHGGHVDSRLPGFYKDNIHIPLHDDDGGDHSGGHGECGPFQRQPTGWWALVPATAVAPSVWRLAALNTLQPYV